MNSDTTTQLIQMLTYILIPIVIAVFGLIGFLVYIHFKEKRETELKEEQNDIQTKKMQSKNNQNKQSIFNFMGFDTVTDNMAMFIVLNTASLQIIPSTVIAIRMSLNSVAPTKIIVAVWIATIVADITGIIATKILIKKWRKD